MHFTSVEKLKVCMQYNNESLSFMSAHALVVFKRKVIVK